MFRLLHISLLLLLFTVACPTYGTAVLKSADSSFTVYHQNGKIKETGSYRQGQKHGKWKEFDENGVIVKMTKYKKGNIIWVRLYKNGRISQITDRKGRVHKMKDCGC